MDKINRILSTAGVCPKNSTRLRSYCNLMQRSLIDKWLFADEFVASHVCLVRDDYIVNLDKEKLNKSQVIVVINVSGVSLPEYKYHIDAPLTAKKVKNLLNQISKDVNFRDLNQSKEKPKKAANRFIRAFGKIRKSFFGIKKIDVEKIKKQKRSQFISKITQSININEAPPKSIVLLGSPGSGKTTFVESASHGKALNSDVSATDSVASDKEKTTVGIDYALIKLDNNKKVKLFGTPGQIKFNFVWDMVGKNADAFVILLDMSRPEPLSYLKFYLKFLQTELGHVTQLYCALTHSENYTGDIASFIDCIESEFSILKSVYSIDGRRSDDTTIILNDIYPQLEDNSLAKRLEKLSIVKG